MPDTSTRNTAHGTVEIFVDAAALACGLADQFVDHAKSAIDQRGRFYVALAGGSTPRAAYALLAVEPRRSLVDWTKVEFFFGDERCVPPENDQSNFRMASETLLSNISLAPEQVRRMHGEADPSDAAVQYACEIRAALGDQPVFDLIMLGLGPDAHTASWFPLVPVDLNTLVDAPYVPKFSSHRLTLTPAVVNAARNIVVATGGAEKAEAISHVFGSDRNEALYPAQRLTSDEGRLTWLIDRAASAGLMLSNSAN